MTGIFDDGTAGGYFLTKWKSGQFPHQRLGQAFVNHFNFSNAEQATEMAMTGIGVPLFYDDNLERTMERITTILEGWWWW